MQCSDCRSNVTQPIESRSQYGNTKRLRKYRCVKCKHEFFTMEDYESHTRDNVLINTKLELDDYQDMFNWLWRMIYGVKEDSTIKDVRRNIENYTTQELKSKLKKYL